MGWVFLMSEVALYAFYLEKLHCGQFAHLPYGLDLTGVPRS